MMGFIVVLIMMGITIYLYSKNSLKKPPECGNCKGCQK